MVDSARDEPPEAQTSGRHVGDPSSDLEAQRLDLLSQIRDAGTRARIEQLRVGPGWSCLDVGAGNGSVAVWLAGRVGSSGRVVATDLDTRLLEAHSGTGRIEIIRHDVTADDFPHGSFDLVHCRALLTQLADPRSAIARMVSWLRPGGWLLVEELGGQLARSSRDPAWRRYWEALDRFSRIDFGFALGLPDELRRAGLDYVDAIADARILRPGSPSATWWQLNMLVLAEPLHAEGLMTPEEIAAAADRLEQPDFLEFDGPWVASWGRRS